MGRPLGWYLKSLLFFFFIFLFHDSGASAQVQPRVLQSVDANRRVTLEGNVHPMARAEFDRGVAEASQPMPRMLLLLKRSDAQQAELLTLMEQQQDKSSPNYHAWVSPQDFGARFGPADADIQAVTDWLARQGFAVDKVYSGRTVIEFSGNAAQVQQAFGAGIRKYEVDGNLYLANAQNPQIPAALAPVVAGIVSLNNFPRLSHARYRGVARRMTGHAGLQPLFTFPLSGRGDFFGVGPGDFATIYNSKNLIASGTDGSGQSIAVVGETNINVQDVTDFRTIFGLPANFSASNIILNGEDPGITSVGEEGEADLDVQWSGATAPGATIKFVVSASTPASAGIDLSALYIIEHNLAGVMSESYGACEANLTNAENAFYNATWEQAAAQGITVVVSSGDGGSAGCDNFNSQTMATRGLAVSGLAGTPFNVSVGGTDFDQRANPLLYWNTSTGNSTTGTSAKGYIPEIPWNESCAQISLTGCGANAPSGSLNIVAGSGGQSSIYHKPLWQTGVTGVPAGDHRYQPDVSLFASPGFNDSGYIVCQQDRNITGLPACDLNTSSGYLDFHIYGGTSASAPAFAGVMALVNQYQAAHGGSGRQGNANYVLYALAKQSGASCPSSAAEAATCIFNDVTKGSSALPIGGAGLGTISVPCQGGTPNCSVATAANTGVLVDPAHTTTEAWTTTTGYDQATGLGSVNVANLATKWASASTVATTTTLTLSPQTGVTHGTAENVTVNVTVKPTTGTATGDVSLIAEYSDGTTQGLDSFTLTNGSVSSLKTQSLPGGSYNVTAHYAGDGTNAPSDSAPVAVSVAQESSKVLIEIPTFDPHGQTTFVNASTLPYGGQFFVRVYVTDSSAVLGSDGFPTPFCALVNIVACPTGTVTLTDNGNPVDQSTFTLNNTGYTRDIAPSAAAFTAGTHVLQAVYSGDNSFTTNTGTDTITVTPAVTTTQLTNYPNAAVSGQPILLQATATASVIPGSAPAGGAMTFYDGATPLPGTVNYNTGLGILIANIDTSLPTAGLHSITAQYAGDSNYGPSTSNLINVNVLNPTAISVSESSNNINFGQSITVTARVTTSSKNPPITGQIQFSAGYASFTDVTTTVGTDTNGNQILTTTATASLPATTAIGATYPGDANYAYAWAITDLINVFVPDFTLPGTATMNVTAGQTGTTTLVLTPASTTPSPVTLSFQGAVPTGATLTLSPTTVQLNGAAVPITLTLKTTGTNGVQSNARTQVKRAGFSIGSRPAWWSTSLACVLLALFLLGRPQRRKNYRALFLTLVAGLLSFALGCGGGGGGGTGGGGPTKVASTTELASDNPKVALGTTTTFTATVTSVHSPTGTVSLFQNGSLIMQSVPVLAGKATFTFQPGAVGAFNYTAQYSGDSSNSASASSAVSQVVTGPTMGMVTAQTGLLLHQTTVTINLQ